MSALAWAYVWLALAVVWGVGGFVLALTLPRGYTGHLLGWVFGGVLALALGMALLPGH